MCLDWQRKMTNSQPQLSSSFPRSIPIAGRGKKSHRVQSPRPQRWHSPRSPPGRDTAGSGGFRQHGGSLPLAPGPAAAPGSPRPSPGPSPRPDQPGTPWRRRRGARTPGQPPGPGAPAPPRAEAGARACAGGAPRRWAGALGGEDGGPGTCAFHACQLCDGDVAAARGEATPPAPPFLSLGIVMSCTCWAERLPGRGGRATNPGCSSV